jgi:hypothetical protein
MPSINGVDFNNVSSINGVSWSSVSDIGGVPVSSGPTCTRVSFGFDRFDPNASCTAPFDDWDYDNSNNILYVLGECGIKTIKNGFVSDGSRIYRTINGELFPFGICGR